MASGLDWQIVLDVIFTGAILGILWGLRTAFAAHAVARDVLEKRVSRNESRLDAQSEKLGEVRFALSQIETRLARLQSLYGNPP